MGFRNYLRVATLVTLGLLANFKSVNTGQPSNNMIKHEIIIPHVPISVDEAEKILTYKILVEDNYSKEAHDYIQLATNDGDFKQKEDSLKQRIEEISVKASEDFADSTASPTQYKEVNKELRRLQSEIDNLERSHYILIPYNLKLSYLRPIPIDTTLSGRTICQILGRISPEDALAIKKASEVSGVSLERLIGIFGKETSGYSTLVSNKGAITRAQILPDYATDISLATTQEVKNGLSDYIEANSDTSTFIRDIINDNTLAVYVGANNFAYNSLYFGKSQEHLTISAYNAGVLGALIAWGVDPVQNYRIYKKVLGDVGVEKALRIYKKRRTQSLIATVMDYNKDVIEIGNKFKKVRDRAGF